MSKLKLFASFLEMSKNAKSCEVFGKVCKK